MPAPRTALCDHRALLRGQRVALCVNVDLLRAAAAHGAGVSLPAWSANALDLDYVILVAAHDRFPFQTDSLTWFWCRSASMASNLSFALVVERHAVVVTFQASARQL